MHSIPEDQISTYHRKLLSARKVADRYSIHIRSISRWVDKGVIPAPDAIILSRRYWYADKLDAADRKRTIEAGAESRSNHQTP